MANKSLNIKKVVELGVHKPRLNGEVIYDRVDNENIHMRYSSPTNVRQVVLSTNDIAIGNWVPQHGTTETKFQTKIDWDEQVGCEYEEFKYKKLHAQEIKQAYYMQCKAEGQKCVKAPDEYTITDAEPLSALLSPWVCSNIQTIIVDEIVAIKYDLYLNEPARLADKKSLLAIVCKQLKCKSVEELSKKFPLLKKIIFLQNLSKVPDKRALCLGILKDDTVQKIAQKIGGEYCICNISSKATKLEVRDGIYRLDAELRKIVIKTETPVESKEEPEKKENEPEKKENKKENKNVQYLAVLESLTESEREELYNGLNNVRKLEDSGELSAEIKKQFSPMLNKVTRAFILKRYTDDNRVKELNSREDGKGFINWVKTSKMFEVDVK